MTAKTIHAYPDRIREAKALVMGLALWLSSSSGAASEAEWITHSVEGEIAASVQDVCEVLRDLESFPRWFPGLDEWRLLDPERSDPAITAVPVYGRQLGFGPFADRDYVVHYRWSAPSAGGCRLEANAVSDATPAPEGSAVRIESMRTRWTALPYDAGTRVRYSVEIAPGLVPEWVRPERFETAPRILIDRLSEEVAARPAGRSESRRRPERHRGSGGGR